MAQPLTSEDPVGNVALLVYRLIERVALRECPDEWPVFAPHVERTVRKLCREEDECTG